MLDSGANILIADAPADAIFEPRVFSNLNLLDASSCFSSVFFSASVSLSFCSTLISASCASCMSSCLSSAFPSAFPSGFFGVVALPGATSLAGLVFVSFGLSFSTSFSSNVFDSVSISLSLFEATVVSLLDLLSCS